MVATERVELSPKAYETFALPLSYVAVDDARIPTHRDAGVCTELFDRVGLEPTLPRLKGECLIHLGHRSGGKRVWE